MAPFSQRLVHPTVRVCTLLGIREIFVVEDLEFPILFNESVDAEGIVVEFCTINSGNDECDLCRSRVSCKAQDKVAVL